MIISVMKHFLLLRVVIFILLLCTLFFIAPILVAVFYKEYDVISSFAIPAIIVLFIGGLSVYFTQSLKGDLHLKQGLIAVPLSWFCVSLVGAVPYVLSGSIPSFIDAVFETVSGLTTTGATTLIEVENLPKTILFWRALTHWLGGMGIVVLTVAIFPLIGIGGNTLLAAETTGPSLEKITPRITHMAKIFWIFYFVLTITETGLLMLAGLDWFDALTHAFATMATGGFSIYNTSLMDVTSSVKIIISIFMILAGINFSLYFLLISGTIKSIVQNSELKAYFIIIISATVFIIINLMYSMGFSIRKALIDGVFQVTSILTTTGFVSSNFELWPNFSQTVLFLLMFIGGCAGSTGGGVKVIRILLTIKYIARELTYFFTPLKVQRITLNNRPVSEDYVRVVLLFIGSYLSLILFTTFVVSLENYDILTSFTTALATLGNIGPGFGSIGAIDNYAFFSPWIKSFLSLIMITGRLELFAVLIIFSPRFWT